MVRWGMIGCGDVAEVKSGPALQNAARSALVAVMRRDRARAEDYARRHGVPRVHATARTLIADPDVTAVYIATPPSSHRDLALEVAAAGKPCLVEKPMAMNHRECGEMIEAFARAGLPLWVAYYRRALPRFLEVRQRLGDGTIGRVTSVHVHVSTPLATGEATRQWRFDATVAGAGLFLDLASHCFDLLDFLIGRISGVAGFAVNSGGSYQVEDATVAAFRFEGGVLGTGVWNFNAERSADSMVFTGTAGQLVTPIFFDGDVVITRDGVADTLHVRNPPHVHQPLIQTIVDELAGSGRCPSSGESAARASWVMDRCIEDYYAALGNQAVRTKRPDAAERQPGRHEPETF
jgi:1,5-anhydro-D-fructose reductase (1,5-anhydro-D-mannitol-forming)